MGKDLLVDFESYDAVCRERDEWKRRAMLVCLRLSKVGDDEKQWELFLEDEPEAAIGFRAS